MSGLEGQRTVLAAKFEAILPHLDERQRRLLIGAEAQSLGPRRDQSRRPCRRCP